MIAIDEKHLQEVQDMAKTSKTPAVVIGATGGHTLKLGQARAISVAELKSAHEGWFPQFMAT